jgi:DNA-binding FadR family transcriptional regulator
VLDTLGQEIVSGVLAAGSVLRVDAAESRFGVSRSVVREAVRVLESMQLVSARRRVGITVQPAEQWNPYAPLIIRWRLAGPDRWVQLQALSELRSGIEPVAARLAAARATPAQCGALTAAVIGMSVTARARDLEAYLAHDVQFHRTLLIASGNVMFAGLATVVEELLAGRTHHHLMPDVPEAEAIRLHGAVATAVQSGHADEAEHAMRAIVVEAAQALGV